MFNLKKVGIVMEVLSLINCVIRLMVFAYCLTFHPIHQVKPANPADLTQAVEDMKSDCADAIRTHQSTTRRRQPEETTHYEWFLFFFFLIRINTKYYTVLALVFKL